VFSRLPDHFRCSEGKIMSYWQLNNKRRTYAGNLVKLEEKGAVPGHWIIEFSSYPTGIWVIPFCILISVFQKNF